MYTKVLLFHEFSFSFPNILLLFSLEGVRFSHVLTIHSPTSSHPLQWKFSQNDATEAQSNAVDINAFFTRILNSLSLEHSPSLSRSLSLYIYFPKLTQSAFISCLLGYIFAFSLPFLPTNYCIPSTLPLHIPFYRPCLQCRGDWNPAECDVVGVK